MTNPCNKRTVFLICRGVVALTLWGRVMQACWAGDVAADKLVATEKAAVFGSFKVTDGSAYGILHYDFDSEPTNNVVPDRSVFENHGVVSGAIWTNAGYTNGSALSFDGSDDVVTIPAKAVLDSPSATEEITMIAWFKTANISGHIIGGYDGPPPNHGYALAVGIGTAQRLNLWTGGSAWYSGNTAVNDDQWHFGAAVVSGGSYTLYLDGNVDGQGACDPVSPYTGARAVGHRSDSQTHPFNGMIDDVRIYNTALSSQEVAAIRLDRSTPADSTNTLLNADADGVTIFGDTTIRRLVPQGDIGMGIYENGP